jgi:hypothetical protein
MQAERSTRAGPSRKTGEVIPVFCNKLITQCSPAQGVHTHLRRSEYAVHPIESDMRARMHREERLHAAAQWRQASRATTHRRALLSRVRDWWASRRRHSPPHAARGRHHVLGRISRRNVPV